MRWRVGLEGEKEKGKEKKENKKQKQNKTKRRSRAGPDGFWPRPNFRVWFPKIFLLNNYLQNKIIKLEYHKDVSRKFLKIPYFYLSDRKANFEVLHVKSYELVMGDKDLTAYHIA